MEKMGEGVVVLVIGMAIVFSVLILLWAILLGFEQVFYKIPEKKKQKAANAKKADAETKVESVASASVPEEDDCEIVAVITAAISAMSGMNASNFKIKSIKRISNWNK